MEGDISCLDIINNSKWINWKTFRNFAYNCFIFALIAILRSNYHIDKLSRVTKRGNIQRLSFNTFKGCDGSSWFKVREYWIKGSINLETISIIIWLYLNNTFNNSHVPVGLSFIFKGKSSFITKTSSFKERSIIFECIGPVTCDSMENTIDISKILTGIRQWSERDCVTTCKARYYNISWISLELFIIKFSRHVNLCIRSSCGYLCCIFLWH